MSRAVVFDSADKAKDALEKLAALENVTYRYSILILTLAAMAADVFPVAGHVGDRLYPISYLSEETLAALDQDDASVEDWVEAVGEPALTPLDFDLWSPSGFGSHDQYDPSNLDFRIWLGWSRDGKIHFAGQFADDVYFNEYDPANLPFGYYDSITLIVDGDHTGGQFLFPPPAHGEEVEGPLETNMQAQFFQAISRVPVGPLVSLDLTTSLGNEWWMVEPPFARGGGAVLGENPTFWSVEFFVTCFDRLNHLSREDSDVSQLTERKIIGFDVYVLDFDDDPKLPTALYYELRSGEGQTRHLYLVMLAHSLLMAQMRQGRASAGCIRC